MMHVLFTFGGLQLGGLRAAGRRLLSAQAAILILGV